MTAFPITKTPLIIPGLALWLDAADTPTITQSNNLVSSVKDKSGRGNNAVNGTGATQPAYDSVAMNGLPSIIFSSNKVLNNSTLAALQTGFTMFYVVKQSSIVSGNGALLFQQGASSLFARFDPVNENNRFSTFLKVGSNLEPRAMVLTLPVEGTPYILSSKYNGTTLTSTMHNNGVSGSQTRTPAAAGVAGFSIFNSNISNLAMSEVLVYNKFLDTADITKITRYLSNKWGIPIS